MNACRRISLVTLTGLAVTIASVQAQSDSTPLEASIAIRWTNGARNEQGRRDLKQNDKLMQIAQLHAQQMAARETMTHSFDGSTVADRAMRAGYPFAYIAENVAYNPGHNSPIREIVEGWRKSQAHNRNMTSDLYTDIGVGVARSPRGKIYACQVLARPLPPMPMMPPGYLMPSMPSLGGMPMPMPPVRPRQIADAR